MDSFSTSDLGLVCYLVTLGFQVESIESRSKKSIFTFKGDYSKQVSDYWNDSASVHPRIFLNTLRDLKARINQGK